MMTQLSTDEESRLLRAAQGGDEAAFESLVAGRRAELHAHCYRMIASLDDADDAVQEALLRAWRALPRFEGRSSLRTWLYRIATNTALDLAARRGRRELPVGVGTPIGSGRGGGEPTGEVAWMGPFPGPTGLTGLMDRTGRPSPEESYAARESLELAYVAALQHLPVHQRATFILREALGFSAAETAEILDTTVAGVNSSLQRARAALAGRLPARSQRVELVRMGDAAVRELAERYAEAIEAADLDGLLSLLAEDASWSMPPETSWYQGREAVAGFLRGSVFPERWRHRPAWCNGQLAVGCYLWEPARGRYEATALDVLDLRAGRIASVTAFLTVHGLSAGERLLLGHPVEFFSRFGLPEHLSA